MPGTKPPDDSSEIPDLGGLLELYAPLTPVPLCPEIRAFTARSLVEVWDAAESRAGRTLPAPFWAFPWPAGVALARVILDRPALVRGRSVMDAGCGGGVSSIACAMVGARVVASDADPVALEVARLAARLQGLEIETLLADLTRGSDRINEVDVVLCGDLAYDRSAAPIERAVLRRAAARGATVLLGNAERTYFDETDLEQLAEYELPVVYDLEGVKRRVARVYRMSPA